MKIQSIVVPVVLSFLLAGCGTVNHTQYQLSGPPRVDGLHAAVSAQDRDQVKEIVMAHAARFKLKDFSQSSRIPNLIVYFQEPDAQNPIKLSARVVGDNILIDLMGTLPEVGETLTYRAAKEALLSELRSAFGGRVTIVDFRKVALAPAPVTPASAASGSP
jgi:hypothetical protein